MSAGQGFRLDTASARAAREDEGVTVELLDIDGTPLTFGDDSRPVTMRVAGSYSTVYRKAFERARDQALAKRRRSTNDEAWRQALEVNAACVLAWDGFYTDGGQPIPFTPANVLAVLEAAPWIREQVEQAITDHARFFPSA